MSDFSAQVHLIEKQIKNATSERLINLKFDDPKVTSLPVLATFVINLDGSLERMDEVSRQLHSANLTFERFPAYDGRGKPAEHIEAYDRTRAIKYFGRALSGGEVGCYLSHLHCAGRFLRSGADYGLVFEDDIKIRKEDVITLRQVIAWLSSHKSLEWDIVNLGRSPKVLSRKLTVFGTRRLVRANYFPTTTHALLWSRAGAERFLSDHDQIIAPVDHYLRFWCGKKGLGLAFDSPLFLPRGVASEIDIANGDASRRILSRGVIFLMREFLRQARNYFNATRRFLINGGLNEK